jgi:acetyl-CoA acetyltransferase
VATTTLRWTSGTTCTDGATVTDCGWSQRRRAERAVTEAFYQAMEEAGIPPHPGGECPTADCRCEELADSIEARAAELAAAKLGVPVPDL